MGRGPGSPKGCLLKELPRTTSDGVPISPPSVPSVVSGPLRLLKVNGSPVVTELSKFGPKEAAKPMRSGHDLRRFFPRSLQRDGCW